MEGEMNRLRRLLDEIKVKYSKALTEIKQLKAVNRELSGCLGWHTEVCEHYEKALLEIQHCVGDGTKLRDIAKKALEE